MDYETLYRMVTGILESVFGVSRSVIDKEVQKTYGDLSPNGQTCKWSKLPLPIYTPKQWEKEVGTNVDPVNI